VVTQPIRLQLPTGFQFGTVNAYLFTEPEPVLVDTGLKSAESWQALEAGLAGQSLAMADLARVIVTHPHVDHCGQARRITQEGRADIWIAGLGRPWLLDLPAHFQQRADYYDEVYLPRWDFSAGDRASILQQLAALVRFCEAVPARRVRSFRVGDTLDLGGLPWQVLHAPGHAASQTCFYQAQTRQFLAADMLLARAPAPILERPSEDDSKEVPPLAQFLESLTMVEALDIDRVYPGHGEPFGEHRAVIRRQRERIEDRLNECLAYTDEGRRTVAALMAAMYPDQLHLIALWMLVGYLDLLEVEGRVEVRVVDGVWNYYRLGGTSGRSFSGGENEVISNQQPVIS
jgi:glyoxylase-like metal-dependent hydrolase (beta-lactamase superfamily II)